MVSVEDKLFTIGGLRDVCVRDPLVPFVERFRGQTNTWDAIDHQPAVQDVELDSFCAVSTGRGSVLMTGGLDPRTNKCTSKVCSVELQKVPSSVVQLTSLICPRAGHCQVLAGGYVYAIGGFQTPHTHFIPDVIRSVECYDIVKGKSKMTVFVCGRVQVAIGNVEKGKSTRYLSGLITPISQVIDYNYLAAFQKYRAARSHCYVLLLNSNARSSTRRFSKVVNKSLQERL